MKRTAKNSIILGVVAGICLSTSASTLNTQSNEEVIVSREIVDEVVKKDDVEANIRASIDSKIERKPVRNYVMQEFDVPLIDATDDPQEEAKEDDDLKLRSLGYHYVTGYTATGNPCASGVYPYIGCCACNGLSFGTQIYISDLGYYTVEDRGGMSDPYHIDIFCDSTDRCYKLTGSYEIFVVE